MMLANTKICTYCTIDDNIHCYERICVIISIYIQQAILISILTLIVLMF